MVTVGQVLTVVQQVQAAANIILAEAETLDPGLALPVGIEQAVEAMAVTALTAWTTSAGTPVTVASVQALLANPAPLPLPTS
jgi:hypothetical protein